MMERVAAAMSQRAARIRERRWAVKDLEADFTSSMQVSNSSGVAAAVSMPAEESKLRIVL